MRIFRHILYIVFFVRCVQSYAFIRIHLCPSVHLCHFEKEYHEALVETFLCVQQTLMVLLKRLAGNVCLGITANKY